MTSYLPKKERNIFMLCGAELHKKFEFSEDTMRHTNICAEASHLEDEAMIRQMMKEKGVNKTPDWRLISLDVVVHNFLLWANVIIQKSGNS